MKFYLSFQYIYIYIDSYETISAYDSKKCRRFVAEKREDNYFFLSSSIDLAFLFSNIREITAKVSEKPE